MEKSHPRIAIFIPCYNCSVQFERVLKSLESMDLSKIKLILVVDNQSAEGHLPRMKSAIMASALKDKIQMFQNHVNVGLGGSFKRAWFYAVESGFDYLAVLHGDNQADFADLLPFIKDLDPNTDFHLGARFMKGSRLSGYAWRRKIANLFLNRLLSILSWEQVYDLGSGLNMYKIRSIPIDIIRALPNSIAFDIELILYGLKFRKKIRYFPIGWKTQDERSTINEWRVGFGLLMRIFSFRKLNLLNSMVTEYPPSDWKQIS